MARRRVSFEKLDAAVVKFSKNVVRDAKKNLTAEKAKASAALYNSIRFKWEIKSGARKGVLQFFMAPYGAYLDRGVTGTGKLWLGGDKFMPVAYNKGDGVHAFTGRFKMIGGDLKKWLGIKGIPLSAEFPIRRSIYAKGIRPRRFFSQAVERNLEKFGDVIGDALNADINDQLDQILKE